MQQARRDLEGRLHQALALSLRRRVARKLGALFPQQTLTGRAGCPEDVAAAVAYLASARAGHVTGQLLQVNGGALTGR